MYNSSGGDFTPVSKSCNIIRTEICDRKVYRNTGLNAKKHITTMRKWN